jgi:DNA-binding LacI/PurR family transcriptional regulator
VITFDDAEPLGLLDPPVTAVRQLINEMGRAAVRLIAATLAGTPQPKLCASRSNWCFEV